MSVPPEPDQAPCSSGARRDGNDAAAVAVVERWSPGRHAFCQEPLFVPRPGGTAEDDGWVLATVFRAGSMTTELVILDAWRVSAGPLATLRLPFHVPIGAHADCDVKRCVRGPDCAFP